MRSMVLLLVASLAAGCGKKAPEVSVSALERTKAHGGLNAVSWTDRQGEHRAVFSIVDRPEDEGWGGGTTREVRVELSTNGQVVDTYEDAIPGCEFDLVGGFSEAALGLTDLDGDGVGELTFASALGCVSGLQPWPLDLVTFEGPDRYVLAGTTHIDYGGGETEGGTATPDAALAKSAFLPHARTVWAKIVEQKNWD